MLNFGGSGGVRTLVLLVKSQMLRLSATDPYMMKKGLIALVKSRLREYKGLLFGFASANDHSERSRCHGRLCCSYNSFSHISIIAQRIINASDFTKIFIFGEYC